MQILTKQEKVRTNLESEEIKFELDTLHPEIMIKIVSDMYPNPRRTLMTEYVQNALDSHGEAGKSDVPIRVTLPTQLSPYYIVRDFGVGMTVDTLNDTFRYVFRSTKNTDPDQLGGFGIGKLVFGAYSGIMHVRLYSGTRMEEYIARLKDGFAGMQFVCGEDSKEEKGVEIRIPVLKDDVDSFHQQCHFLYSMLPTRPVVTNYPNFWKEFDEEMKEHEFYRSPDGNSLLLKKTPAIHHAHGGGTAQVLIGGLPFRLDWGIFRQSVTQQNKEAPELIKLFEKLPLYLRVGPNDVDIVPSRDNLKYNKKTCEYLLKALRELRTAVQKKILEQAKSAKTYGEIREFASFVKNDMPAFYGILGGTAWDNGFPFLSEFFDTIESKCRHHEGWGGCYHRSNLFFSGNHSRYNTSIFIGDTSLSQEDMITAMIAGTDDGKTNPETQVPKLRELVTYLYSIVTEVRGPKVSVHGKVSQTDMSVYKDRRCCLLPLAPMFKTFREGKDFNGTGKPVTIFIYDQEEMTKTEASRRILHLFDTSSAKFAKGASLIMATKGVGKDALLKKLNDTYKLGIETGGFVNVHTLPKPPPVPAGTRAASKTKGKTEFGANSIFLFDEKEGKSSKDNFNLSFWKPLDDAGIAALEADPSVDILFLCISAYKPCRDKHSPPFRCLHPDFDTSDNLTLCSLYLKNLKRLYEGETGKRVALVGYKPGTKLDTGRDRFLTALDSLIFDKLESLRSLDAVARIPLQNINAAIVLRSLQETVEQNADYTRAVADSGKFDKKTGTALKDLRQEVQKVLDTAMTYVGVKPSDLEDLQTALGLMPFFFSKEIESSLNYLGCNVQKTLAGSKTFLRTADQQFLADLGLGGLSKSLLSLLHKSVENGSANFGSQRHYSAHNDIYTQFLDGLFGDAYSRTKDPHTIQARKELEKACGKCATGLNTKSLEFIVSLLSELEAKTRVLGPFSQRKLSYFGDLKEKVTGLNSAQLRALQYLWYAKSAYSMPEDYTKSDIPHFSALLFGVMTLIAFTQFYPNNPAPKPVLHPDNTPVLTDVLGATSVALLYHPILAGGGSGHFIKSGALFTGIVESRYILEVLADYPQLADLNKDLCAFVVQEFQH